MSDDFADFFEGERARQREREAQEQRRQEHLAIVRRVLGPFNALMSALQENFRLRQRSDASQEEYDRMHSRLADVLVSLARCLKAEGWEDRFDNLPPSTHRPPQIADRIYALARQEDSEALLALFRQLQTATPETKEDVWKYVVQNSEALVSVVETTFGGVPSWSNRGPNVGSDPAEIEQPEEIGAGEQSTPAGQAQVEETGSAVDQIGVGDEPILDDKHIILLVALLELDALTGNKRCKLREVIQHHNRRHDPDNYKHHASDLVKWKLINSTSGPAGGYWLTVQGRKVAEQHKGE